MLISAAGEVCSLCQTPLDLDFISSILGDVQLLWCSHICENEYFVKLTDAMARVKMDDEYFDRVVEHAEEEAYGD